MQIANFTRNCDGVANRLKSQLLFRCLLSGQCSRLGQYLHQSPRQSLSLSLRQRQRITGRCAQGGYTLIELAIVVALVGILTAIAIPSYDGYITRTNRAEAKDLLSDVMFQQERFNTRNRRYTQDMTELGYDADPTPSAQGYYTVDAFTCDGQANVTRCVLLRATPVAGEAQEGDGILELDSLGNREPEDKWNK